MWNDIDLRLLLAQPAFTCSVSIIKTVQNLSQVNYKDTFRLLATLLFQVL